MATEVHYFQLLKTHLTTADRKKKKNQYLIFQLFQYIGLSSSVADFTSKISKVFQSTKQHFIPNCLAKKNHPGMAVLKNLPFQHSAETLWYLLDRGEFG